MDELVRYDRRVEIANCQPCGTITITVTFCDKVCTGWLPAISPEAKEIARNILKSLVSFQNPKPICGFAVKPVIHVKMVKSIELSYAY